jgi:hypothetical protein
MAKDAAKDVQCRSLACCHLSERFYFSKYMWIGW